MLRPRARARDANDLVLRLPNVRQAHVYMAPTLGKASPDARLDWYASAWGVVAEPALFGSTTDVDVVLAPSLVRIPSVVALTLVLHVYLPPAPAFKAVAIRFAAEVHSAVLATPVFGFADDTPTDFAGLHLSPFGLSLPPRPAL
jgi:hypothetical protein